MELFVEFKEITSAQLAEYMRLSDKSMRILMRKWVADGFLQIVNPSNKSRTYGLTEQFEEVLNK